MAKHFNIGVLIVLIIGVIGLQTSFAKKDTLKVEEKISKKNEKTEEKEETKIKIDGILEVGFDKNYKANKDSTYYNRIGKAQIDISARPTKKVRAEIGLEYNQNNKDSLFTIDKLYGQYSFTNFSAVRFGYMKKSFGLEEKTDLGERYFRKRSLINDNLDEFGFLEHDLTLQYRHDLGKKWHFRGGFSWTQDSVRYLQNYSVEYKSKKNNLLLASIIRHYLPQDEDVLTTFVSSLSYKRTEKLFASEAELTFGTNPVMKAWDNRDVFIFGARVKENFSINTGVKNLPQIIPVAEAAFYANDLDSNSYDVQLRTGLTLGFAKKSSFQWRNNYGIVSKIEDGEKKLWRRRFDSEVVVIF